MLTLPREVILRADNDVVLAAAIDLVLATDGVVETSDDAYDGLLTEFYMKLSRLQRIVGGLDPDVLDLSDDEDAENLVLIADEIVFSRTLH